MRVSVPRQSKYAPLLWIGAGGTLLFWLSLEDQDMLGVTLLGTMSAMLLVSHVLMQQYGGQSLPLYWFPPLGALVGAGAALNTTLLMFFKTAWHAHPFPDFPPQMMLDMLARMPFWGFAGMLVGLGIGALWYAVGKCG